MAVNYSGKKFYNIGTMGQCFKTNTALIYCHLNKITIAIFITLNLSQDESRMTVNYSSI
jgi:hypothetical protein